MKNFNETSWITSDGMIWLQILDRALAVDIMVKNTFELFVVNLINESEYFLYDLPTTDVFEKISKVMEGDNTDEIICIPVGKLDVYGKELYKIPKKHGNT